MYSAKDRFDDSYNRIKVMHSLYTYLLSDSKFPHEVISDILRSELVAIVSALDRYIHDIVKVGIIESYIGRRPMTQSCSKFQISLNDLNNFISSDPTIDSLTLLGDIIDQRHSHLSFQDPKKISDALSLIWNENQKWQSISSKSDIWESDKEIKIKLKNIVIRRNQIVHEADYDAFQNQLQEISSIDVENSVELIKHLVEIIHTLINDKKDA